MELVHLDAARRALDLAMRFEDVMQVRNVAEQAATFARLAKNSELIERATELRARAHRKAGEMLRQAAAEGHRATRADGVVKGANKHSSQAATSVPTLADIGITKSDASRFQQLASMPAERFEQAIVEAKATRHEVTTAFLLREAKQLAAPRGKPAAKKAAKKMTKAAKGRLEELEAAKARGISMLTTYARLTLTALRAQTSFTEAEIKVLGELSDALQQVSETEG